MIGQTIAHDNILEKLGRGGMGVVYKAPDTELDQILALKFLPRELSANEDTKHHFIQEVKAASAHDPPDRARLEFPLGRPTGRHRRIETRFPVVFRLYPLLKRYRESWRKISD